MSKLVQIDGLIYEDKGNGNLVQVNGLVYEEESGAVTITGTGTLSAQAATVSGTGVLDHTGTGTLSAQSSTVSGTGVLDHTGTGVLTAQSATVSGTGTLTVAGGRSAGNRYDEQQIQLVAAAIERRKRLKILEEDRIVIETIKMMFDNKTLH